jgi:arabinan endo-1,5-alpha-L-arabinosidase
MADKAFLTEENEIRLSAPAGVPYPFKINIRQATGVQNGDCVFEIFGKGPQSGVTKTCRYHLDSRDHHSYLDLFGQLAHDFGLRLPQNRQSLATPTFRAAFKEVLRVNSAPGMVYGYGDPAVIRVEEGPEPRYYLLATSNDAPDSFPLLRSRNLVDWEFVGYVFPRGQKPAWAADGPQVSDYWAPEMHQVGGEFRVYFVARHRQSRELCIGLARSPHPEGPFYAEPEPLVKGNVIDPHILVEDNGTAFLYWKEDNNDLWPGRLLDLLDEHPALISQLFTGQEKQITASFVLTLWPWARDLEPMERFLVLQVLIEAVISEFGNFYDRLASLTAGQPPGVQQAIQAVLEVMRTPVYAQQLSPGGSELVGERTKIIENDLAWEAHLVEGIWVTRQRSKYYLFYAGNDFSTHLYGIGVAVADAPLGPYRKVPEPFLQSTADWWAPGHPSVATDPKGQPHLFLHAYFPHQAGYKQFRALLSVPVTFQEDRVELPQVPD